MKQALYIQIERIKDKDIQNFVSRALDNAPEKFWIAESSPSGKHHPPEDQGEGGVIRHLIKSAYVSDELSRFFSLPERERDVVIASSIIHDIKKNGEPWGEKTNKQHGLIAYEWLGKFDLKNPEKEEIRNCVRYHMAQWIKPDEELERALNPSKIELVVQLSDYFSSRMGASFLPGINLSQESIINYLKELAKGRL